MPRLDIWLVENGYFTSRQQSKRAIRAGHVRVNGKIVKASTHISGQETIEVSHSYAIYPKGYFKLKSIESTLKRSIAHHDSLVLDIGSSAGGFLSYLAEKNATAIGIEVSEEFADQLLNLIQENHNLSLIVGDAFEIHPSIISPEKALDLLLIDVTTDIEGTLQLVKRFSCLLKHNGMLLAAFKQKPIKETIEISMSRVSDIGYFSLEAIVLDRTIQEFHIAALRR